MKRIVLLILGIVLLTGCQKEKTAYIEPTPYVDPKDPAIINIPVPDLKYRTGGQTHLVRIDYDVEAYDYQLKIRTLNLINDILDMLGADIGNGNNPAAGVSATEDIKYVDTKTMLTNLLELSTTSTLTSSGIHNYVFTYKTVNGKGEPTTASAALMVPKNGIAMNEVPVLVCPMFGLIDRFLSASRSVGAGLNYGLNRGDKTAIGGFTPLIYELMARTGYAVLIPDGLGMGDNHDSHMLCTKTNVYPIIDALLACRDIKLSQTDAKLNFQNINFIGMSEGAYSAMESCKVLQEEYSDLFNVGAAACVDGPYDVSETMRNAIFPKGNRYHSISDVDIRMYLIPVIFALSDTYGAAQPFLSYKNALRNDVEGIDDFPEYVNEFYTNPSKLLSYRSVLVYIQEALGDNYKSESSALSPQYLKTIQDPHSFVNKFMVDCNAFNNWLPKMKIMLFQYPADGLIPPDNSKRALEAFRKAGSTTVDITYFNEVMDAHALCDALSITGDDIAIHINACFAGLFKAFKWLDKQVYGERIVNR